MAEPTSINGSVASDDILSVLPSSSNDVNSCNGILPSSDSASELSVVSSQTVFFGVFVPPSVASTPLPLTPIKAEASISSAFQVYEGRQTIFAEGDVFSEMPEALKLVKKFKDRGARFKQFSSYGLALDYAQNGPVTTLPKPPSLPLLQNGSLQFELGAPNSLLASPAMASASNAKFGILNWPGSPYPTTPLSALRSPNLSFEANGQQRSPSSPGGTGSAASSPGGTGSGVEDERPLPFPAPSRAELTTLRRAIMAAKDVKAIREKIESNPRVLINAKGGDAPTILFEGCRYNALHEAAKSGCLEACRLIVSCVRSNEYVARLYQDDSVETNQSRCDQLYDAYLNSPEKGNNETPLHLAVKQGHFDVVDFLTSLPGLKIESRNKYDETAMDLCAKRDYASKATRSTLAALLSPHSRYVALYRFAENSLAPILAARPLSRQEMFGLAKEDGQNSDIFGSDIPGAESNEGATIGGVGRKNESTRPTLAAYAGPCSQAVAEQILRQWAGVRFCNKQLVDIKRSDLNKGMERIGRTLAQKFSVPWRESWFWLDFFIDLSSDSGLKCLDAYLTSLNNAQLQQKPSSVGCLGELDETKLQLCRQQLPPCLEGSPDFASGATAWLPPGSSAGPASASTPLSGGNKLTQSDRIAELAKSKREADERMLAKRKLLFEDTGLELCDDDAANEETPDIFFDSFQDVLPIAGICGIPLTKNKSSSSLLVHFPLSPNRSPGTDSCSSPGDDDDSVGGEGASDMSLLAERLLRLKIEGGRRKPADISRDIEILEGDWPASGGEEEAEEGEESFVTPPASPTGCVFIGGSLKPSRWDLDAYLALEAVYVDPVLFPAIHRWRQMVAFYPKDDRLKWPGFDSPRGKQQLLQHVSSLRNLDVSF